MNAVDEMVCVELVELITGYLEGVLPERDRDRFEAHLDACAPCRDYVEGFRAVIAASAQITAAGLEDDERERLLELFRGLTPDA